MQLKPSCPHLLHTALLSLLALLAASKAHGEDLLAPEAPIHLTGTHGRFDFLAIDPASRRLLAAHTGNGSMDVIELDIPNTIKSVPAGKTQAPVVHANGKTYYVTSSTPPEFVTIDAETLKVTSKTPLAGPADLAAIDSASGKAYVGHDDGKELWIVDPANKKVVGSIALPGEAPEDLAFDNAHQRLFQAMKTGNIVAVIDLATGKVAQSWPTAPAEGPHGMALIAEADAFAVVGGNGKLVLMSQKDGHVISSTGVANRVDQICYDPGLHRIYCASGTGKISVVALEDGKLHTLGDVPSAEGAHSIAVDAKTHTVWIAYAKGEESFVQQFKPAKP